MQAVNARAALDQFKTANPRWWESPALLSQWQRLQRAYEQALLGYSLV